eukprot:Blabericola_migrator_1__5038@NODE_2610_length_2538_cov_336_766491_g1638_i0_p3_GENE_NODE_2610_length_2538_cov_336_766491_g1638_i0NODE_2610_length_2538_cov_336_766491_g1638_i0_p3_ORF_typecomplete_len165_score29_14ARPC4/PF05856_12/0_077_NODE_2610_length_2538_cov_336_766491_g1638_i011641658
MSYSSTPVMSWMSRAHQPTERSLYSSTPLSKGLPRGLWRSDCTTRTWGETETPFMFFRDKASLEDMLTALPSLLMTLPKGGGIQNSVVIPLVEADDKSFAPDEDDEVQALTSVWVEKITFPLYSEGDEIEDILIERTANSIRVSGKHDSTVIRADQFPLCCSTS